MTDLRLAARRLLATPLFTVFAVLSLAIGVAVTTAVYSVVDSIFLRDAGARDPDRVVIVVSPYDGLFVHGSISLPDFQDLRAAQTSFTSISASASFTPAVASSFTTELLAAEAVDGAYFSTLGVSPAMGRTIQPADDAGAARVVVLSHALWRRRFAANPAVVGQIDPDIGAAFRSGRGRRGVVRGGERTIAWHAALDPAFHRSIPVASRADGPGVTARSPPAGGVRAPCASRHGGGRLRGGERDRRDPRHELSAAHAIGAAARNGTAVEGENDGGDLW